MRRARHASRADWFRCHVPDVFDKYVDAKAALQTHMDRAQHPAPPTSRRKRRPQPREQPRVAVPRLRLNAIPLRPADRPLSARTAGDTTPVSSRSRPSTARAPPKSTGDTPRNEPQGGTAVMTPRPPAAADTTPRDPAAKISSALVRGFLNECGLRDRVLTRRREIVDYDDRIILVSADDDPEKIPSLVAIKKRVQEESAAAAAAGKSAATADPPKHKVLYDYSGKAVPVEALHHAVPPAVWPPWQNRIPKQTIFYDYAGQQISVEALHCPVPPGDWPPKQPTRPRPNPKARLWL